MNWWKASGVLLCAVTLSGASDRDGRGANAVELGVKDRANANASIATSGTFVGLTWAARTPEGVTDIYAAMSRDEGRSFGPPARVNQVVGEASASGEQPPRAALVPRSGSDPSLVVAWTAKGPAGTRLVFARSDDGARSFGAARPIPGGDATGNRGWESIATGPKGNVVALWLDHREVPARAPGGAGMSGAHQHGAGDAGPPQVD
ncbi:MAG: hypothetical protein ABI818_19695, partial [Acidobacteriota bacterium]